MKLTSTISNSKGQVFNVEYNEGNPLTDLEGKILQGVHAFCIVKSDDTEKNGKMILVNHPKSGWIVPGGGIEVGETYEEAVIREVAEETATRVISQTLIGYQDIFEDSRTVRQTRSFCIVEMDGSRVLDPDGEIQEIMLIDPRDYKKYFDWGQIGDHIMRKAIKLTETMR